MDLYRIGMPEDNDIIVRDKFIVDNIYPFCIKKISEDQYSMLFYAEQISTESALFLQSIFNFNSKKDEGFLNNHPLNVNVIQKDPKRLEDYNEKIDSMHGNIFNTDFDMKRSESNKRYFEGCGIKALNLKNTTRAARMDLYITRDNFIKLNLFITKFLKLDYSAESVFTSKKLKNLEFLNIEHIKLNGSCENKNKGITYSNYTVGVGPTSYNFNFISPYIENRYLINHMVYDTYELYMDEFTISDIIKDAHEDVLYIPYEVRDDITNSYKRTVVLIMNKDIYNHSNLVQFDKIYEKDKTIHNSIIV